MKRWIGAAWLAAGLAAGESGVAAPEMVETFKVATYNLESYIEAPVGTRPAKSAASKSKIRESIRSMSPDVLAVQEIGGLSALSELVSALKAEGLDYPHSELVTGYDTNLFVAVLSRFPIIARRPHTNENFLLQGRRFRSSRGFAEVDIRVSPRYSFTLIAAHLKSRRTIPSADEADMREQEAILLREKVDARLAAHPDANVVVVGDLNDTKDARAVRVVVGRGKSALVDARPAERNGDNEPNANPRFEPRTITWTHYYGKEDSYQRIDYILMSRGMACEWDASGSWVVAMPNWGTGSDHRPVVATFHGVDR